MQNLTEKEKAVVRALQGDFPLVADTKHRFLVSSQ